MKHEHCQTCYYILHPCSFCGASKCKGCGHTCQPEAVKAYQEQKRIQSRIKMRGYRANWREAMVKAMQPIVAEPVKLASVVQRKRRSRSFIK